MQEGGELRRVRGTSSSIRQGGGESGHVEGEGEGEEGKGGR